MNSIKPKISIITVVLNGEMYIEETINSVICQNYTNYEYIIIDGDSSDTTMQIIERYREFISVIISEKDSGIYNAMNKGLSISTGKWLSFINAGDRYYNCDVLTQIFDGKNYDEYALIYGDVIFKQNGRSIPCRAKTNERRLIINPICHQSVFIKSEKHRSFDESFKLCSDHDVIFELFKKEKTLYIPNILSIVHDFGVSSNAIESSREKRTISLKYGDYKGRALANVCYNYNLTKFHIKKLLIKLFPYCVFVYFQKIKFFIESRL